MKPLVSLGVLILLSCGGADDVAPKGLCPEPATGSPTVLFDLFTPGGEQLAPFPSDLLSVADPTSPTGQRLSFSSGIFADGFNELDGFGTRAVLLVPHARSIDPATLPATPEQSVQPGSSVFLLDLAGIDAAEAGTLDERKVPVQVGSVEDDTSLFLQPFIRNAIAVRPEGFLEPNHKYAMVVTACVTNLEGDGLGTQDAFADLRSGGTHPDANPAAVADLHEVIDYLETEGYHEGDLAMVTTFTTQDPEADLLSARVFIDEMPSPVPVIDDVYDATAAGDLNPDMLARMPGLASMLDDFDLDSYRFDRIDKVVFGTFDAPSFVTDEDLMNRDPDTWEVESTGTETLEFLLTIPREVPAEGIEAPYKVLVFQHAMGVCKETILPLADTLARFGIAVVGIDALQHGTRHPDGPGGCEIEFTDLFVIENFAQTSAYFEQSIIDVWSLVRMILDGGAIDVMPYPGGDGVADLDTTRLAFAGQSMGASLGLNILALEPAFGAGVVNVGMGYIVDLMLAGMGIDLPEAPMPELSEYNLFQMNLGAVVPTVSDRCDPIHWADNLLVDPIEPWRTGPMHILYQQASLDDVVPYEATIRTSGLMQIPAVTPLERPMPGLPTTTTPVSGNYEGDTTAALFQYDELAGHEFLLENPDMPTLFAGQLQLAVFVSGYLEGETPVIIDPFDAAQVATYAPNWVAP